MIKAKPTDSKAEPMTKTKPTVVSPQELVAAVAEMASVALDRVELSYSWVDGEFMVAAVVYLNESVGRGTSRRPKRLIPRGLDAKDLLADLADEIVKTHQLELGGRRRKTP